MLQLGVNIDHVATVRQARRTNEPDPVHAAVLAEMGGADQITVHLRGDRRHIQDRDVRLLREMIRVPMNLEMGLEPGILQQALEWRPERVCIVPETREEVTTEGGLDVAGQRDRVREATQQLQANGTYVSLFIDPDPAQVQASIDCGADIIELHTGRYANAWIDGDAAAIQESMEELVRVCHGLDAALDTQVPIASEANRGSEAGHPPPDGPAGKRGWMAVDLGHGLTLRNLPPLLDAILPCRVVHTLNIGHTIVANSIYVGMERAVREMKEAMQQAERHAYLRAGWYGDAPRSSAPPATGDGSQMV